jgi:hypothetical protein
MTGTHNTSAMPTSTKAVSVYFLVMFGIFCFMPEIPLLDGFPGVTKGSEAFTVGRVYLEVIGGFNLMLCMKQCPGMQGYFMASAVWCAIMSKHFLVDGLMPPPPVIAMGAVCLLTTFWCNREGGGKLGQWLFLLAMLVIAAVFLLDTQTPLTDSFPGVSGEAKRVGTIYCEVVGFHAVMLFLSGCPAPTGNMMAFVALGAGMAKHMTQDDITPPVPVMGAAAAMFCLCLVDFLSGSNGSKPKQR